MGSNLPREVADVVVLVMATMRLTDALLVDRIFDGLRRRLRWYVFGCPRCLSVWIGALCTVVYLYAPLVLYPLALSWFYLWMAKR
jgi:hypothetical protein